MRRQLLFFILVLGVFLSACGAGNGEGGISTHTPSPSPSPTCQADFLLSTPEGWEISRDLVVMLYDPLAIRNEDLVIDYLTGSTDNVQQFTYDYASKLLNSGLATQISIFELGHRRYEDARRFRIPVIVERPELYETPSPLDTPTAYPTMEHTPEAGLEVIQATNQARAHMTEQAAAAELVRQLDGCAREQWDTIAKFTATAWAATQAAEETRIAALLQPRGSSDVVVASANPTPYLLDVVYDGLYHATIDFKAECLNYDRCILIIVDDLNTWGTDNPNNLDIDLTGVEIFALMPNCRDINQPSCVSLQEYWTDEFLRYGAAGVQYLNGERAEFNLDQLLRR
ncbi:MAG TPA: hypothetical protein PLC52_09440 [Anaerolineales bacterium]|nr:hypothetical protein [Anaerolineales bacterium]HRQ93073.1 hypothetical protein [Anaerolineales bacterium]